MQDGDIACDIGGRTPGLHPHMCAGAIHAYLRKKGFDPSEYYTFTVTRNPLDMLWSYYKFFQPDDQNKYNYDADYNNTARVEFDDWLAHGRVGVGFWRPFVPKGIGKGLSALSLEAHVCDPDNQMIVNDWFRIEDLTDLEMKLSGIFSREVHIPSVNQSYEMSIPSVSDDVVARLAPDFPMESKAYGLAR